MAGRPWGQVTFEFFADQPPATKAGEWRARLGSHHFGSGPTIDEALYNRAMDIEKELAAVEKARTSIRDTIGGREKPIDFGVHPGV